MSLRLLRTNPRRNPKHPIYTPEVKEALDALTAATAPAEKALRELRAGLYGRGGAYGAHYGAREVLDDTDAVASTYANVFRRLPASPTGPLDLVSFHPSNSLDGYLEHTLEKLRNALENEEFSLAPMPLETLAKFFHTYHSQFNPSDEPMRGKSLW
jgi:hypothetical protein